MSGIDGGGAQWPTGLDLTDMWMLMEHHPGIVIVPTIIGLVLSIADYLHDRRRDYQPETTKEIACAGCGEPVVVAVEHRSGAWHMTCWDEHQACDVLTESDISRIEGYDDLDDAALLREAVSRVFGDSPEEARLESLCWRAALHDDDSARQRLNRLFHDASDEWYMDQALVVTGILSLSRDSLVSALAYNHLTSTRLCR